MAREPRELRTRTSRIHLDDEGIVHVTNEPGSTIELAEAEQALQAVEQLAAGTPAPLLVRGDGARKMTRQARQLLGGVRAARVVAAQAIVVQAPVARAIGSFFMGLNRPPFPTRMFSSEEQARGWLRQVERERRRAP